MGCYDSVIAKCAVCGGELEFQSKAGKCHLLRYHISEVPAIIAESLDGALDWCETCGKSYQIVLPSRQPKRISMVLQDANYLDVEEDYD